MTGPDERAGGKPTESEDTPVREGRTVVVSNADIGLEPTGEDDIGNACWRPVEGYDESGVEIGVSGGEDDPDEGALVLSMSSSMSSGSNEPWL